ncbi:MAG TPA: hypothetical protein VFA18_20680 [Gemmataceae bacterium]|nr:hypothetical protein [Gemmataceae bacterium]
MIGGAPIFVAPPYQPQPVRQALPAPRPRNEVQARGSATPTAPKPTIRAQAPVEAAPASAKVAIPSPGQLGVAAIPSPGQLGIALGHPAENHTTPPR